MQTRPLSFCLCSLGLFGVLMLGACNPIKGDRLSNTLHQATEGYQTALRWGYFENAYAYLAPDRRMEHASRPELAGLRLTGYEVLQGPVIQPDQQTAVQTVAIDYLYEDLQVVRHLIDRQVWRYDPQRKTWWLASGLPDFKR